MHSLQVSLEHNSILKMNERSQQRNFMCCVLSRISNFICVWMFKCQPIKIHSFIAGVRLFKIDIELITADAGLEQQCVSEDEVRELVACNVA